jgi:hypothetical protein
MIGCYSSGGHAMPIFDSRTAEEKMNDAMNAKRKEWYGPNWHTLDFWGLPITKEPKI